MIVRNLHEVKQGHLKVRASAGLAATIKNVLYKRLKVAEISATSLVNQPLFSNIFGLFPVRILLLLLLLLLATMTLNQVQSFGATTYRVNS